MGRGLEQKQAKKTKTVQIITPKPEDRPLTLDEDPDDDVEVADCAAGTPWYHIENHGSHHGAYVWPPLGARRQDEVRPCSLLLESRDLPPVIAEIRNKLGSILLKEAQERMYSAKAIPSAISRIVEPDTWNGAARQAPESEEHNSPPEVPIMDVPRSISPTLTLHGDMPDDDEIFVPGLVPDDIADEKYAHSPTNLDLGQATQATNATDDEPYVRCADKRGMGPSLPKVVVQQIC